jgi:phosphatidylserine decarboxylase
MRWQTLWQAKWILLILAATFAGVWAWTPWAALAPAGMILFTLYFFRDPHRRIPEGEDVIVSPADGRVTDIGEMDEEEVTGRRMLRVGIFLSVFDVHVNRAPAAGRVVYTAEHAGDYHDARSPMASTHNAARTWAFDCGRDVLVVRQITGAIARRIVPWAMVGDRLERGEHFGMIRFGSRTEIFLPVGADIAVKIGEQVQGGSSILGRLAPGNPDGAAEREEEAKA